MTQKWVGKILFACSKLISKFALKDPRGLSESSVAIFRSIHLVVLWPHSSSCGIRSLVTIHSMGPGRRSSVAQGPARPQASKLYTELCC